MTSINKEDINILCDALGGRMSLIYEYGERKEADGRKEGSREILQCWLDSGDSLDEISKKTGKSIEELEDILADD